ncbi:hypothetical protein HYH02_000874 [Chlamydomonas schloesseri]|uniref:ubiquitinyl hydrolase 1 n=1 Tax=Chlamydomonas schloesseri TaxID=2026947 RepID=A0A836BDS0_9CHLO|nr:hypothetical protein HYH02_000874 [Chlamydomonas schloesseri]|eukprot:KAG2455049.1 hypothetical protein HYH02_000874 [Chlamydomonas schloesseri]
MPSPWCEPEGHLHAVFDFPHLAAAAHQQPGDAEALASLLAKFVEQQGGPPSGPQLRPVDRASVATAVRYLQSPLVSWFPEYGCAVLARGPPLAPPAAGPDAAGAGVRAAAAGLRSQPDHVSLHVVAPDEWRLSVHASSASGYQHTAKTGGEPSLLPCGMTIPASELPRTLSSARALMDKSLKARTKSGEHGFQRTPAFIHAAVTAALQQAWQQKRGGGFSAGSCSSEVVARGGTTDVGQHTGSDTVRCTSWPLVRATLQVVLERMGVCGRHQRPALVFRRAMALFDLWLAHQQVERISRSSAASTPVMITAAVHMLQAAGAKAAGLAALGEDTAAHEAACTELLTTLGAAAARRALQAAEQHIVPPATSHDALGSSSLPSGVLPEKPVAQRAAGGLEAAKQRAAANLGSMPLLPPGQSFEAMLRLLTQEPLWSAPAGDAAAQHVLRTLERELFTRVVSLAAAAASGSSSTSRNRLQSEAELAALVAVVDCYRNSLHAFLRTAAAASAMECELRSRETLVAWAAFCLADELAGRQQALVLDYQPPLQFSDLWHLVLSDRLAVDALLAVAAYLHARQRCAGPLLFSLRDDGKGTLAFAASFAAADSSLAGVLMRERADAAARVQAHWALVQQRQEELRKCERELAALKLEESALREERSGLGAELAYWSYEYKQLSARIRENADSQRRLNTRINQLKVPPEAVLQPLPASDSLARQWLFFLHMPPLFRHLSRLGFLAQQLLLPRPLDSRKPALAAIAQSVAARPLDTALATYYDARRAVRTYLPANSQTQRSQEPDVAALKLSASGKPPDKVGPSSLELYSSSSDGVWYPDALRPSMLWAGGASTADRASGLPTYFNPFAPVDGGAVEEFFTERLPASAAALQWALRQHRSATATPADRGNWALAKQEDCPPELLSKAPFLQFGRLRAYPLQQLRNLCDVLRQGQAVPLTEPAVQALLRQLLFHVGALTATGPPRLLGRTRWDQEGDVLAALCTELSALADILDGKVRDHDAILLLGEMAAYLADWHEPCGAVARRFAAITMREADRLRTDLVAAAGDDRRVSELLARQLRWRVMALVCYSAGPLRPADGSGGRGVQGAWRRQDQQQQHEEDAAVMVRLMVQICHGLTFQEDAAKRKELQLLRARAHNVMASRLQCLTELIRGREDEVLTAAVASVLDDPPASLPWQPLPYTGAGVGASFLGQPPRPPQHVMGSYQAVGLSDGGRLYSINILDGTVLFDGWRPSRLPKEITQHPLYLRTFGGFNFEVAFGAAGSGVVEMRTLRKVRGCLYEFRLCAATTDGGGEQRLIITEVDAEHGGERLELLDAGADSSCKGWGEQLPVRLRKLHSHWLSRPRGVLVLRPRSFQEHACSFLAACITSSTCISNGSSIGTSATECEYDFRRVPLHLQSQHWRALLPAMPAAAAASTGGTDAALTAQQQCLLHERLVLLPGSKVVNMVLGKFEDRRFIHAYTSVTTGEMSFELPRCGLEFTMQPHKAGGGGCGSSGQADASFCQLLSRNYSGYRLRRLQQLAERRGHSAGDGSCSSSSASAAAAESNYTLPGFTQYLVLERIPQPAVAPAGSQRAQVMVLTPAGLVSAASSSGKGPLCVHIIISGSSAAEIKVHRYEVHGRFGHLRAPTRLARLQLAALYAATSTLLPEPGSRCTGAQMAMELLRQCWSTRPLEAPEAELLAAVGRLGGHLAPGLHLLAHDLAASAVQLAHLHVQGSAAATTAGGSGGGGGGGGGGTAVGLDVEDAKLVPHLADDHALAYEELLSCARRSLPPGWGVNPRLLLTRIEEERVLDLHQPRDPIPPCCQPPFAKPIAALEPPPAMPGNYVKDAEAALQRLLVPPRPHGVLASHRPPAYPLAAAAGAPRWPLQGEMHKELRDSWDAHHEQPDIAAYEAATSAHRRTLEAHLLQQLGRVPQDVGCPGASLRLLRAAAIAPTAATLDLARAAVRPELLTELNPFLSPAAAQELLRRVLMWLQLCVLEDRLGRVAALATALEAGDDCLPQLVQELLVERKWSAAAHPQWLVFEVESQLQIRPLQYTLAHMLMQGRDGAIAQLNMGEGKTRVILPMLLLAMADGERVVSLTCLSTLLDEAYAYLHGALCAGALGRKLFTLPFHRDVGLTPARVRRMRSSLAHCAQERGLLLVSPEQRLSLELKWKEYLLRQRQAAGAGDAQQAKEVAALLTALFKVPLLNILDESDELLHHRFQLIYACGDKTELQSLEARTGAICAVLRAVTHLSNTGLLRLPHAARVLEPPSGEAVGVPGGAFCGLRLLPGADLEAALVGWYRQLVGHVLEHLPFEFRKMESLLLHKNWGKKLVVACVTVADTSADGVRGWMLRTTLMGPGGAPQLYDFILALRGLLGCGVLRHGLLLRQQVEYGIDRRKSTGGRARTRMAVPYRAAHTPSERSEFAQPDVALLLTHLAYYYDGLSLPEFTAAVERLLHGLGKEAAADHYREWLELAGDSLPPEDKARFADVNQLDASSSSQMATMHRHLRRNTAVVDFWLRYCVLPAETRQYPQRLGASAWDLAAAGDRVMGFSGTNDNYRLLPLRVHQAPAEDPALKATNGKMLEVITRHTLDFHTLLPPEDAAGVPVWRSLLDVALSQGAHALLDCGALLADTSNSHAAEYLLASLQQQLQQQQPALRGVTYYDEGVRGWVVLEPSGRRLPRDSSPLQEHETFVLYDEARCRGADLKLQRRAVGLLTLGPRVCKDKLMQAAGRLRQLGRGQALRFAATVDIAQRVFAAAGAPAPAPGGRAAAAPQPVSPATAAAAVLAWVMDNTVEANLHGVAHWAAQGLHFATTLGAPQRSVQDEVLGLAELYAGSKALHPVANLVAAAAKQARQRCLLDESGTSSSSSGGGGTNASGGGLAAAAQELMGDLQVLAARYGKGHVVRAGSGADEECERELEQEVEEEQEVEKQPPKRKPASEVDWRSYPAALSATSVASLRAAMADASSRCSEPLLALRTAVSQLSGPDAAAARPLMADMAWSDQVYATENYVRSIADLPPNQQALLGEYLRPVGWLLALADGAVVLLSEREADQLLAAAWGTSGGGSMPSGVLGGADGPLLVSLAYAWQAVAASASCVEATPPLLVTNLGAAAANNEQSSVAAWGQLRMRLGVRELVTVRVFAGETSFRVRPAVVPRAAPVDTGGGAVAAEAVATELRRLVEGRRPQVQQLLAMRGQQSQMARSDLEKAVEGLPLQLAV